MSKIYWKVLKLISITVVLGASLTACGSSSWKEEVLLHDGTKIIVERSVNRGGRHEIGQPAPIKDQSLTFIMPDTKQKVVWEDNFTEDIGGANFLPMMLDISKGMAYLVVYPMGCLSYNKWGRPNPPYVIFKYENGAWKRIKFAEFPAEFKDFNLISSSPDETAKKLAVNGLVSAEKIKQLDIDHTGYMPPEYKTILIEPIKANTLGTDGSSVNCEVMVRFEGGWAGPDYVEMTKRQNLQLKKQRELLKQNSEVQK